MKGKGRDEGGEWYQTPYLLDYNGAGVKWILPASARDNMKGGDTNGWYPSQTNPLPPRFVSIFLNRSNSCLYEDGQNPDEKFRGW
jgi:hypothetical protein